MNLNVPVYVRMHKHSILKDILSEKSLADRLSKKLGELAKKNKK